MPRVSNNQPCDGGDQLILPAKGSCDQWPQQHQGPDGRLAHLAPCEQGQPGIALLHHVSAQDGQCVGEEHVEHVRVLMAQRYRIFFCVRGEGGYPHIIPPGLCEKSKVGGGQRRRRSKCAVLRYHCLRPSRHRITNNLITMERAKLWMPLWNTHVYAEWGSKEHARLQAEQQRQQDVIDEQ